MTKIFLIRHAEAEGNIYRRAHGQFNGLIIGRGFAQIEQLRERFTHEKIDAVYSSDLTRTQTTAMAICEPRGLRVNTTPLLREVNIGEWEDTSWGDLKHRFPEMCDLFGKDPALWSAPGGETYRNVRERMRNCISGIGRRHDGEAVAVFSHGFAIRAFLCEIKGIPSHNVELVPYCDNTAVTLLRFENDDFRIEYQGDNSHLCGENSTFAKQTWWREENERKSEDLHYIPFDDKRDSELFELCEREGLPACDADLKLTAFLEEAPAGLIWLDTGSESGAGRISRIYIKPDFRRMYLGIQLLGQAVSECRKLRRETLRMETAADSPAMAFGVNYGFVKAGGSGGLCLMEKDIRNW